MQIIRWDKYMNNRIISNQQRNITPNREIARVN